SAADVLYRYGGADYRAEALEFVEKALDSDPKNRRAAILAELIYTAAGDWPKVSQLLGVVLDEAPQKDDKVAAGLRLARVLKAAHADATSVYEKVLAIQPGQ